MTHNHTDHEHKKELQQTYLNVQLLQHHLQQHSEQLQALEQKIGEITTLLSALDDLTAPKEKKILATLGGGIFLDATIHDTSTLYVNVGADVIVKKPLPAVKELLKQQQQELEGLKQQFSQQAEHLQHQLSEAKKSLAHHH